MVMQFCDSCGSAMVKVKGDWVCRSCEPEKAETESTTDDSQAPSPRSAKLDDLPTTGSGSVRKKDAMRWLNNLNEPSPAELRRAFLPKPTGFTGSTYATSVSQIRITGDPKFVETVAGLLKPIQRLENAQTRVAINLQQAENKDTGEMTENYALYLSVAQRG